MLPSLTDWWMCFSCDCSLKTYMDGGVNYCCPTAPFCVKHLFTCYPRALSIMWLLQQNETKCAQGSTLMVRTRIVLTAARHFGCLDCSLSVISFLWSHMMLPRSLLLITPVSRRGYGQIKRKVLPLPHGIVDASDQDVSEEELLSVSTGPVETPQEELGERVMEIHNSYVT